MSVEKSVVYGYDSNSFASWTSFWARKYKLRRFQQQASATDAKFLATVVGQKVSGLYVPDHGARVKLIDSTRSYSAFAPQSVLVQWRNNRVGKVQGPRVQGPRVPGENF